MDSAKNAVKGFLSHNGKHQTDVHSTTAPAVTNETVKQTNENRTTTAIDQERHQDHYHTTVQPVHDKVVNAEQHHHNLVPTEKRHFEHDDSEATKRNLANVSSQFKDTSRTVDGGSTVTAAPNVAGEHVHHVSHFNHPFWRLLIPIPSMSTRISSLLSSERRLSRM